MPSAALDLADRLDLLVSTHVMEVSHRRDDDCDKPIVAKCRVCGGPVRRPRYVYCEERCNLVIYGRASARTLRDRVERELVLLREKATAHVFRSEAGPSTALDDGEPRVPTELAARIAHLEAWAAKLRGGAA